MFQRSLHLETGISMCLELEFFAACREMSREPYAHEVAAYILLHFQLELQHKTVNRS